ncbi:uncharacterized protein LOC143616495 [Bidens hawaiensis]|uniref:uncharacterized protein LOC143616495 n=1 Tax=Bidens hawaiensis TaxID=980011 RepID=UPI00404A004B
MSSDKPSSSVSTKSKALHPVYSVSNIQNKIRTLDGTSFTYSSWVKLFTLHAKGYKVLQHIDGTPPPDPTHDSYESWAEIDAIVLQWIYGTISQPYLAHVLDTNATAQTVWNKLKHIFLSNKKSRAAALEKRFTNLTLSACSSLDDYCQKLQDLAEQLNDVDHIADESRLVVQLVNGLPKEYDACAMVINQTETSWDDARTAIDLERQRKEARADSAQTAFVAPNINTRPTQGNTTTNGFNGSNNTLGSSNGSSSNGSGYNNSGYMGNNYQPGYRGRGRGRRGGRSNSRGGGRFYQQQHYLPQHYPPIPWTNTPPCPHPAQGGWTSQWQNPQTSYGPYAATYGPPMNPTELGQALQAVNLQNDPWFMDSGASSHLTADPGKIQHPTNLFFNGNIFVGNGQQLPVTGTGHSSYHLPNRTFQLFNILLAPQVFKDLLSVRKFSTDNQVSIDFDAYGFSLKDLATGRHISRHNSTGDLYPFTKPTFPSTACLVASSTSTWHNRLGHPRVQTVF